VERTHTEAICEELQTVGRTHVGENGSEAETGKKGRVGGSHFKI